VSAFSSNFLGTTSGIDKAKIEQASDENNAYKFASRIVLKTITTRIYLK